MKVDGGEEEVVLQVPVQATRHRRGLAEPRKDSNSATSFDTPQLGTALLVYQMNHSAPLTPPATQDTPLIPDGHCPSSQQTSATRHEKFYSLDPKLKDPVILQVSHKLFSCLVQN